MIKSLPLRGFIIMGIGMILLFVGSNIFDTSYESVEKLMKNKKDVLEEQHMWPQKSMNFTIDKTDLFEHNVLLLHETPTSVKVLLQVLDPNGQVFEKETKDGFAYHLMDKRPTDQGNSIVRITNPSESIVYVKMTLGEDPYLSGKCDPIFGIICNGIPIAIGLVISGLISLIVGILLIITDFRKKTKQKPNN